MADPNTEFKDQTNILPKKELLVVFCALSLGLLISFIDQNSLAVSLPLVGKELNATNTISWAGTSTLIANTTFQVLFGRLSDIFGRKSVLVGSLSILCLSQLATSVCQTSTQLYVFRAFAGIGNGGVTALTMIIVSDIVTLEERGKYQGILGMCVGLGNALGPLLSAAFSIRTTWRGIFYLLCPTTFVVIIVTLFMIPQKQSFALNFESARKIDYLGIVSSSLSICLILIPISGGGNIYQWNSPLVISMIALGGLMCCLFLYFEWKVSKLPMMPLRVFKNPSVAIILLQNVLFGMVYYANFYFLPLYFQVCRGWTALISAILVLPMVLGQAVTSTLSGQVISRTKSYGYVLYFGFTAWFLGNSLQLLFNLDTSPIAIVFILLCQGFGVGCVFQPTIVAAQAHCKKEDRAVIISIRNLMRSIGGAFGLAAASSIMSNVLASSIRNSNLNLSDESIDLLVKSIYSEPDLSGFTEEQKQMVFESFMHSLRMIFIFFTPLLGICWIACFFIRDRGLQREKETETPVETNRTVQITDRESKDNIRVTETFLEDDQILDNNSISRLSPSK